jgi:hypothetical protein
MVKKFNIIQFVIQKNYLERNNIDVVIEHRFFTASEDAKNILKQGQIGNNICAYKSVDIPNVVHGVNCRRKN